MNPGFWFKRLAIAFLGSAALLFPIQLAKGNDPLSAAQYAAFWGGVFALLFTLVGYLRYRRNPACLRAPEKSL